MSSFPTLSPIAIPTAAPSIDPSTDYRRAAEKIHSIWSSINAACALLTLGIIYLVLKKGVAKWNGFISIFIAMTCYQFTFDLSSIVTPHTCEKYGVSSLGDTCFAISKYLNTAGSLGLLLWSNLLIFTVSYVVFTRNAFNIQKYFTPIAILVFITTFVIGVLIANAYLVQAKYENRKSEYCTLETFRVIFIIMSVCVNVFIISAMFIHILRINEFSFASPKSIRTSWKRARQSPVFILALRLSLYSLIQTIARFPSTLMQLNWNDGFKFSNSCTGDPDELLSESYSSKWFLAVFFLDPLLSVIGGIGDLIIYLIMQNGAKDVFFAALLGLFGIKYEPTSSRKKSIYPEQEQRKESVTGPIRPTSLTLYRVDSTWNMYEMDEQSLIDEVQADKIRRSILSQQVAGTAADATVTFEGDRDHNNEFKSRKGTQQQDTIESQPSSVENGMMIITNNKPFEGRNDSERDRDRGNDRETKLKISHRPSEKSFENNPMHIDL